MHAINVLIEHGSFAVWLILLSGIMLVIIGGERLFTLFIRLSYRTDGAIESIRKYILGKSYTEALQVCNAQTGAPDLAVVKSALLAVENGREAMKSALGGALLEVGHKTEARLGYLSLIANVATLLGLLGTISGLIKTFAAIADADASEKARLLGLGISEAMYATAAGLVVGILAMVAHTICVSKADGIVGHAQDVGFKVITWVEQSERAKTNG
jgi:biopolymer transport protein ExbB